MTTSSASRRSGWVALLLTTVARVLLFVLASLALWAVAPAVMGLKPTVVMTGSMLPRLVPGDIVLSRPVPASQLQLRQTLLFPDPDQPGHLRMHRWVDVAPDGRLVTKGDANPSNDSTTITRADVLGVASLRVPFIGRPVVWAADGEHGKLVLTGLGLVAVVAAAFWFRAEAGPVPDDDEPRDDDGAVPADEPEAADEDDADDSAAPGGHGRRLPRRLVRTGVVLLVVVGLGASFAGTANAAATTFGRTTANPTDSWNASTYFTCAGAARAANARFTWPLSETNGTTANDVTTNNTDGTYAGGVTYGVAGPCRTDNLTGVTLNGTSGVISTTANADSIPELTLQVWFRTTSTKGGTLMSLTTTSGFIITTDTTSMAIGMTTTGTLVLGATTSAGAKRATSTAAYRDNVWHQATGVVGAGGMVLYVDGVAVANNTTVTSAASVTGTPRVGYGDASDLTTGTNDYFTGSVAFASLYKASLPAATVLAQYQAASV